MSLDSTSLGRFGNSNVRVFYRIFPEKNPKWDLVKLKSNSQVFIKKIIPFKDDEDYWVFDTDGIFHNAKQEDVYGTVVGDLLEKLDKGQNLVVVGFGQPGTGKSATMAGLEFASEDHGIGPRIMKNLLKLKKSQEKNRRICIQMSYAEFSGFEVYDLLQEFPNKLEDHWSVAQKLKRIKIRNEYQALKELYMAEGRKETKPVKNYSSHSNTSILTFYVKKKDMDYSEPRQITGKVHVVDMAGSDTLGNLSCIFKSKLEVKDANLTKSYMTQFFLALCQKSNELIKIKQRGNPFIYFLGADVKSQSSLRFIGHVTISQHYHTLTLSMLKFGQIVRGFSPTVVNLQFEISPEHKLKYLQCQIEDLEKERIQNSVLLNKDLSQSMNTERIAHLQKTVKEYLKSQISEIEILSVTDASMIFKLFKELLEKGETDMPDTSFQKKKSSLTVVKKEKKPSIKKGKESPMDKRRNSIDKQTSIQSLTPMDDKNKGMQERSSTSINHTNPQRKKSKQMASKRHSGGGFKRRSVLSVTSAERISDSQCVPDVIPENAEAWNEYTKISRYNFFLEEYKANEKSITDTYSDYLTEIKLLHGFKDQIEAMKQELLEARIMMKFKEKTGDVDKYTETILSEAEVICKDNTEKAEKSVTEQQEIVLRTLAELKIYLNNRREMRKKLSEDFDNFCKTKYQMLIPQLKSLSELELIRESKYSTIATEVPAIPEEPEPAEETVIAEVHEDQLSHLKKIMDKERKNYLKAKYNSKKYILC